MREYERVLANLYPSEQRFRALLPKGNRFMKIDLSKFGLRCEGYIGKGTFSDVYRAVDKYGSTFAVKVTEPGSSSHKLSADDIAQYALREIELSEELVRNRVRGIVPILRHYPDKAEIRRYISDVKENRLYHDDFRIIESMPLGLPYDEFIKKILLKKCRISERQFAALALDLLTTVKYMHLNTKIVHRDLKPENILLIDQSDGKIRADFTDFNVSKCFGNKKIDPHYTTVGSKGYIHIDLLRSSGEVDIYTAEAGDVYSIGVILYQMLNNNRLPSDARILPPPKYCPSERVADILRAMLSSDIRQIPCCDKLLNELYEMTGDKVKSIPVKEFSRQYPHQGMQPVQCVLTKPEKESRYVASEDPFGMSFFDDVFDDAFSIFDSFDF